MSKARARSTSSPTGPLLAGLACAATLFVTGCAPHLPGPKSSTAAAPAVCSLATARPWIERWFAAWELTSKEILRLKEAGVPETTPIPEVVFFDETCVYTTSARTAGGAPPVHGPRLGGVKLPWRAVPHGGSLTLPDAEQMPVALSTFTNVTEGKTPYFVMAAPAYWEENGHGEEPALTGIFLHEFAHTRQILGMAEALAPIDAAWDYPEVLNDDAVQTRFAGDPEYVDAYTAERDLLFAAAAASNLDAARTLAAEALAALRERHARWFTGEAAVFAPLDDVFLALEGVGQWAGYAWLAHREGGAVGRDEAIRTMLGSRKWWVQDEGLALLLAVDRLLPEWPALEFATPAPGASDLLARAVGAQAVRELPSLGSEAPAGQVYDGGLAIASSEIDLRYRVLFERALFDVTVDGGGEVSYLQTSSTSFATPDGLRTGAPWSDALAGAGEAAALEPGWACHVRLPSGWYAATRLLGSRLDRCADEVEWVFQRR